MRKYADLIDQTFHFPTDEFKVENDCLHFNGVNLLEIIKEYGTPLKLSYLPKIEQQLNLKGNQKDFGRVKSGI